MEYTGRYRSFFWPAVLILVGIIALLVNTGQIPVDRLALLLNLWPVVLVVVGLEIIVRRSVRGPAGDVAGALILVVAVVAAATYVAVAPNPGASHVLDLSAEVGDLTEATAEVDAGGATINVSGSTDVGANLYRAHITYSGNRPRVNLDRSSGRLTISQQEGPFPLVVYRNFTLDLKLNPGVAWKLEINTGASTAKLDLGGMHVGGVSLNTGASRQEITLGQPSGKVPIEINGGALTVTVHRPSGVAVSVSVDGGAVNLTADGQAQHAVGSATYKTSGFDDATDGYRIEVNGGASTVTIDSATPSG